MWLFRALAGEEIRCGLGQDEADREVGMVGECGENVGDFDRGYGTTGCEEKVEFAIT